MGAGAAGLANFDRVVQVAFDFAETFVDVAFLVELFIRPGMNEVDEDEENKYEAGLWAVRMLWGMGESYISVR